MLFRPVYFKPATTYLKPPMPKVKSKSPSPKAPKEEILSSPQPPVVSSSAQVQKCAPGSSKKCITPMLVCGYGVTSIFPVEATGDVFAGKVDYFLVDDRGVTLVQKRRGFDGRHQRFMDRNKTQFLKKFWASNDARGRGQ